MSLLDLLTSRDAVLDAIEEFDALGRDQFLAEHGYAPAREYWLLDHDGKSYDSKAIAGVAVGKQHPERGALLPSEFSGGGGTIKRKLEELGFTVVRRQADGLAQLRARWEGGGKWTKIEADTRVDRLRDLPELRSIIEAFLGGASTASEFRYQMDGFGKRTRYAGFAGIAGQMFFNQLVKAAPELDIADALRTALQVPADAVECRVRFDGFLGFVEQARQWAEEQGSSRPSFGYAPYFLSFFWEAYERESWPIYYPASRNTLVRHGLFVEKGPLGERYLALRDRILELREELGADTWTVEAFLWELNSEVEALEAKKKDESQPPEGKPKPHEPSGEDVSPAPADFYESLRASDLIFPDELVTSLVLSLMTKPFVLLSGISGTGKTQLAAQLAEYLDRRGGAQPVEIQPPIEDDANIYIRLTDARLRLGRSNLTAAQRQAFALHGGLPERGSFVDYPVPLADGPSGSLRLNNIGFSDTQRELFLLFFRAPVRDWLQSNARTGDYLHLRFDDAEDGGLAEARLVRRELEPVISERHRIIAVKSDWTDPHGLIGFENPITERYVQTELIHLLLEARDTPLEPYFVILDEMNLARVEYYFSDFLSAMELSGGGIVLRTESTEQDDSDFEDGIPARLPLPKNVLFIGTVNIDETTFTFSPKVLDRANVLTFNDVDVLRFLEKGGEAQASTFRLKNGELTTDMFVARSAANKLALERARALTPFSEALVGLFSALEPHGRQFGYRVLTEITTFVGLALDKVEGDEESIWREAFDLQLVQKVLPKLSGGRELEGVLTQLLQFCMDGEATRPGDSAEVIEDARKRLVGGLAAHESIELAESDDAADSSDELVDPIASTAAPPSKQAAGVAFPRAARAVHRMLGRLRVTGFVSFLE